MCIRDRADLRDLHWDTREVPVSSLNPFNYTTALQREPFFFLTKHHFKLTFLPLCFKFQSLSLHSLLYTKLLKSPTALKSKIFQKAVMPNLDWLKWNQTEGKIFWTFPRLVHCLKIRQQVIKIDYLAFPHETNTKLSVWAHYSLIQTREASEWSETH